MIVAMCPACGWDSDRDGGAAMTAADVRALGEAHECPPKRRTANAWVRARTAEYRAAYEGWKARKESGEIVPPWAMPPGCTGAAIAFYQLAWEDYKRAFPCPRLADFMKAAATPEGVRASA